MYIEYICCGKFSFGFSFFLFYLNVCGRCSVGT